MTQEIPGEIVIVRRRGGWDEEAHGHGVWKIAYADFMTAMMAFFLVMWLINVTDDSVRRGVAQYFNPVRLASTAPHQKGLNDPNVPGDTQDDGANAPSGDKAPGTGTRSSEAGPSGSAEAKSGEKAAGQGRAGTFAATFSETDLLADPYAVLESLASAVQLDPGQGELPTAIGAGQSREAGARGGEAFRDPFDPMYWQFLPNRMLGFEERGAQSEAAAGAAETAEDGKGVMARTEIVAVPLPPQKGEGRDAPSQASSVVAPVDVAGSGTAVAASTQAAVDLADPAFPVHREIAAAAPPTAPNAMPETVTPPSEVVIAEETAEQMNNQMADAPEAAALQEQVAGVLERFSGTPLEETARHIAVAQVEDGVLISLTDDQDFGMFAIGSSEPRPELVRLLQEIAGVLKSDAGAIVIKGHTDGRPYRSKTGDNWQLSSARARMALYMLERGGIPAARFERVEGYADRDLRLASDPYAAVNRRVEILLRKED